MFWLFNYDLFGYLYDVIFIELDVVLMLYGLQREREFIVKVEGFLVCGIMVEKSSERVKYFIFLFDYW